MKAFFNIRQLAAKKRLDATFVTSGAYASCFVDHPGWPPGRTDSFIETHGLAQAAGLAMKEKLVALGIAQNGVGAPRGNNNAGAENRKAAQATKGAEVKKARCVSDPTSLAGALLQNLAQAQRANQAATLTFIGATNEKLLKQAKKPTSREVVIAGKTITMLPERDESQYSTVVVKKRSHHKKVVLHPPMALSAPLVPAKRSHHKKKA